jgi:hypothetical protein
MMHIVFGCGSAAQELVDSQCFVVQACVPCSENCFNKTAVDFCAVLCVPHKLLQRDRLAKSELVNDFLSVIKTACCRQKVIGESSVVYHNEKKQNLIVD